MLSVKWTTVFPWKGLNIQWIYHDWVSQTTGEQSIKFNRTCAWCNRMMKQICKIKRGISAFSISATFYVSASSKWTPVSSGRAFLTLSRAYSRRRQYNKIEQNWASTHWPLNVLFRQMDKSLERLFHCCLSACQQFPLSTSASGLNFQRY